MTTESILDQSLSRNTRGLYRSFAHCWEKWCRETRIDPWPVREEPFLRYIAWRAEEGDAFVTLRMRRAAVRSVSRDNGHGDPLTSHRVVSFYRGLRRSLNGDSHRQVTPVTAEVYRKLQREYPEDHWLLGVVGLMRDGLLRRSEAAAVRWDDLQRFHDGSGRLLVRRSKTDQYGTGHIAYISAATMDHVWQLPRRGELIFRRSGKTLARRVRIACERIGITGANGHSMRIGMAQDLAEAGATTSDMMQAGRWKTPAMVASYTRSVRASKNAVAKWHKVTA